MPLSLKGVYPAQKYMYCNQTKKINNICTVKQLKMGSKRGKMGNKQAKLFTLIN